MGTSNDWSERKRTEKTGKIKIPQNLFSLCKKKDCFEVRLQNFKDSLFLPGTRLELARGLTSEGF